MNGVGQARGTMMEVARNLQEITKSLLQKPREIPNDLFAEATASARNDILFSIKALTTKKRKNRPGGKFNHNAQKLHPKMVAIYFQHFKLDKAKYPLLSRGDVSSRSARVFYNKLRKGDMDPFIAALKREFPTEMEECKLENTISHFKWNAIASKVRTGYHDKNDEKMRQATKREFDLLGHELLNIAPEPDGKEQDE